MQNEIFFSRINISVGFLKHLRIIVIYFNDKLVYDYNSFFKKEESLGMQNAKYISQYRTLHT